MDSNFTEKNLSKRDIIFKTFTVILTVLTLLASLIYGRNLVSDIRLSELKINAGFIALAAVFFILFYKVLAIHWKRAVRLFASTEGYQENAFYASQPYKYLPTSLFVFSFRAGYAKKLGVGLRDSSKAQLVEMISMFTGGGIVFCVFYLADTLPLASLLAVLGIALILLVVYTKKWSIVLRKTTIKLHNLVKLIPLTIVAWILAGISFYFLSKGIGSGVGVEIFKAIYANCASYILSILAFFAPGGIGIREASLNFFGSGAAAILGWRLLTLLLDIIIGLYGILKIQAWSKPDV